MMWCLIPDPVYTLNRAMLFDKTLLVCYANPSMRVEMPIDLKGSSHLLVKIVLKYDHFIVLFFL